MPFDPPLPDRSTVGGIVAANLNGPRRSSYGSVRDLVIGMKVVLASGEVIKAGGKVVSSRAYTIAPGYSQTFREDRAWVVEFSRAENMAPARYGLKSGLYSFTSTDHGWDLYQR